MDAPKEDLIRYHKNRPDSWPSEMRASEDGRTLYGYAAIFDEWTEINSWEGRFSERLVPGAFKKTLKDRGDKVKVLFNHGFDPTIGDKPLGKATVMREDEKGLYVEVPLDDTSYNRDLIELLRSGALDGMSFRFSVVKEEWEDDPDDDKMPERSIFELKLFELGPVTFPAYEATEAGVRTRAAYQAWRTTNTTNDEAASTSEEEDASTSETQEAADDSTDEAESTPAQETDEPRTEADDIEESAVTSEDDALVTPAVRKSMPVHRIRNIAERVDAYMDAIQE